MKHTKLFARFAALMLACLMAVAALPVGAAAKSTKLVFSGTVTSPNLQVTPYYKTVAEYVAEATASKAETTALPRLDPDAENFMNTAETIAKAEPDAVFLEFDISQKRKGSDDEIAARAEAVVKHLLAAEKTPAIYFIYVPEGNFMDYRAPLDIIAKHYNITVIDTYRYFKQKYDRGELEIKDFLTAGVLPGEGGHALFATVIVDALRKVNVLQPTTAGRKALYDTTRYAPTAEETVPNVDNAETKHTLYVSAQKGSDTATGTKDAPLKTLAAAQKKVRELRAKEGAAFGGVTVYLREGLYQVGTGFELTKADSGTENARVIWRGYPGETVRMTNASVLKPEKFSAVTSQTTLNRLPNDDARGHVLVYDLRAAGIDPGTYITGNNVVYQGTTRSRSYGQVLVVNGKGAQRAQYPNGGWQQVCAANGDSTDTLTYEENVGTRWTTADNAWVVATTGQGYYTDQMKVTSVDSENRIIKLGRYAAYGIKSSYLWKLVNLLEELDMPSEWYVDVTAQKLYYYPQGDILDDEILFSSQTNPIISMNETSYVTIADIDLTAGCGDGVKITDGVGNRVENCTISNMGHTGVYIRCNDKKGPGNNGVSGCHIYHTAISGVMLEGGDRKELTPSNDFVENCHFEQYATEMHSEAGAVLTDGTVGVAIRNNTIHNDDSAAVFMGGNDDLIEGNEIYNVCYETDDYGVIYGDSRGAMRQGVTMRKNYMHDIVYDFKPYASTGGMLAGFYSDANRNNGAKVDSNIFVRVQTPIFFSNNHNMAARGNLLLDNTVHSLRVWLTPYDTQTTEKKHEQLKAALADGSFYEAKTESAAVDKLLYRAYQTSPEFTEETENNYYLKYPWLEHYLTSEPLLAKYVVVSGNASFGDEGRFELPNVMAEYMTTENNYITDDAIPSDNGVTDYERIDKAMTLAAENVEGFEVWDVRTAGIQSEERPVSDFELLYPRNGQKDVDVSDLRLCWQWASGADSYHVVVAQDAAFKNIVHDEVTVKNYAEVKNLNFGAQQYYWKVTASSYSAKFTGTPENLGGVHSFVSMKQKEADFSYLKAETKQAEALLNTMTESSEVGNYPEGTKLTLQTAIDSANAILADLRTRQAVINEGLAAMKTARLTALSRVNLSNVGAEAMFGDLDKVQVYENALISGTESSLVQKTADGIVFKGNGAMHSARTLEPYEAAHFKATFDFGGQSSGSYYTMFGLRTQKAVNHLWNTSSYVFLVTKENIELQSFKAGGIGKFYLTVPNTFIEEGKEHDIQFAAVPSPEGVRILLQVDGEMVYDYVDKENIITNGGLATVETSNEVCGLTLAEADEGAYPSLIERIRSND